MWSNSPTSRVTPWSIRRVSLLCFPFYYPSLHTPSHCADAILSLANKTTVVGDVATTLSDFVTLWVTTTSDYDMLIARTMSDDWAREHRPVLSRKGVHTLYTGFTITEPNGGLVRCHQGCGNENRSHHVVRNTVVVSCRGCNSSCIIEKVGIDSSTTLGGRSLVKTRYPPTLVPAQWRLDDPSTQAKRSTIRQAPTPAVSTLPSGPTPPSMPRLLVPPPPTLSHSASLPALRPAPVVRSLEAVRQTDYPLRSRTISLAPTPTSTATPWSEAAREPPLTIRLPALRVVPPIMRSQSLPQVGQVREPLKRSDYPTLELSTSSFKRQKKK
jgi:hypothetical protein